MIFYACDVTQIDYFFKCFLALVSRSVQRGVVRINNNNLQEVLKKIILV